MGCRGFLHDSLDLGILDPAYVRFFLSIFNIPIINIDIAISIVIIVLSSLFL